MQNLSSLLESFLRGVIRLSKTFRKIFSYLQWFFRNSMHCFPSFITIAEFCNCSERHAKRAIALFESQGWLSHDKRGYQSNLYEMPKELQNLDLYNNKIFLNSTYANVTRNVTPIVTQNVPVLCIPPNAVKNYDSTEGSTQIKKPEQEKEPEIPIPACLNLKAIPLEDARNLAKNFSEHQLVEAVEDARWYYNKGNKIKNLFRFVWARARKH